MKDLTEHTPWWNKDLNLSRCVGPIRVLFCIYHGLLALRCILSGLTYLTAAIKSTPVEPWGLGQYLVTTNSWLLAMISLALGILLILLSIGVWRRSSLGWWTMAIWMFAVASKLLAESDHIVEALPFPAALFVWLVIRWKRAFPAYQNHSI